MSKTIRVLLVTTSYPRWAGDHRAPFIHETAKALTRQGCQVRVLSMGSPGAKPQERLDGIEVFRPPYLPEKCENLQSDRAGLPESWRKNPFTRPSILFFAARHALATIRLAREADLIHANWTLSGMTTWLSYPLHRKPFLVTVHGSDVLRAVSSPLVRFFTRRALHSAHQVIADSTELEKAVRQLGISPTQVRVVPVGVDLTRFTPGKPERPPLVLFVGSLTENKGVHFLIEAFSTVAQQVPAARLRILGDGPAESQFRQQAERLGIGAQVEFAGAVSPERIPAEMRSARVLALPSLSEGLGVVLIEAMASATPCVATRTGGIIDIVTPETGFLIDPGSIPQLTAGLLALLQNDQLFLEKSAASLRRVQSIFSWDRVSANLVSIYTALLQGQAG